MPTRSYSSSDFTNFVSTFSPQVNGSNSGTGFNISSIGSGSGIQIAINVQGLRSGEINYSTVFPSIPVTALISNIRVVAQLAGTASGTPTAPSQLANGLTASIGVGPTHIGATYITSIVKGFAAIGGPQTINFLATPEIELEITPVSPITRAQLQTDFGQFFVRLTLLVFDTGALSVSGTGNSDYSSWTVDITYDLENYSWYIKPTVQIVNGLPIRIIESANDILAIVDGDEIPEGYEFYGTGDAYPDGPVYEWWSSVDFYLFYIFSPINPSAASNPTTWVALGITPPTCTGCTESTLGELDILVADASGVYVFDPEAIHDSLYVREGFSLFVDTEDVKIPNPFGKIGPVP